MLANRAVFKGEAYSGRFSFFVCMKLADELSEMPFYAQFPVVYMALVILPQVLVFYLFTLPVILEKHSSLLFVSFACLRRG